MSTATADWGVLDLPEVMAVIKQAASRAYAKYPDVMELEDLEQEATIMVVTTPNLWQAAREEDSPGLLQFRLGQDLSNMLLPKAKQRAQTVSYDQIMEETEAGTFVAPYVVIETASNEYSRQSVETLLPAIWDESFLYSLPQRDTAPDPDMPRGSSNKAHSNNLSAYIADIKTGWEKTPLTLKERRALFLAYNTTLPGGPWTHQEIAYNQNVDRTTITHRIESAVGKIVARLNGGFWYELKDIEA